MWKESEHPRNEDGQFVEKEKAGKLLGVEFQKQYKIPQQSKDKLKSGGYFGWDNHPAMYEIHNINLKKLQKDIPNLKERNKNFTKGWSNYDFDESKFNWAHQPIIVNIDNNGKYYIKDGWHRLQALINSGYTNAEVLKSK